MHINLLFPKSFFLVSFDACVLFCCVIAQLHAKRSYIIREKGNQKNPRESSEDLFIHRIYIFLENRLVAKEQQNEWTTKCGRHRGWKSNHRHSITIIDPNCAHDTLLRSSKGKMRGNVQAGKEWKFAICGSARSKASLSARYTKATTHKPQQICDANYHFCVTLEQGANHRFAKHLLPSPRGKRQGSIIYLYNTLFDKTETHYGAAVRAASRKIVLFHIHQCVSSLCWFPPDESGWNELMSRKHVQNAVKSGTNQTNNQSPQQQKVLSRVNSHPIDQNQIPNGKLYYGKSWGTQWTWTWTWRVVEGSEEI